MIKQLDTRKKRNRRRIWVLLIITIIVSGLLLARFLRPEELPVVRTAILERGSINSQYYVTAEIRPGSITHYQTAVSQRVDAVLVQEQQQIKAGDLLARLDQSELADQYEQAREQRMQVEASLAEADEQERLQDEAQRQAQQQLERQIASLSSSLSASASHLARLAAFDPFEVEIAQELEADIARIITQSDPDNVEQDVEALLSVFRDSIAVRENQAYAQALAQLERELQQAAQSAGDVLSGLTGQTLAGALFLPDDLSGQLGSLAGLGMALQNPLDQAVAAENLARERYEQSEPYLYARKPGIVAEINIQEDDYTGNLTAPAADTSLASLFGGSSAILTGGASPALVVYDNTAPEAFFYAGRFDADRLETGMPVLFTYGEREYQGEVTYKSKIASSGSGQLEGLDLLGEAAGSSFSSEPQLEIAMRIDGENLTDLITGFWIDAQIETASANNALLLPAEAMRREINVYYVFTVDSDGVVSRNTFEPGIQSELYIEVLSGLTAQTQVILNPPAGLADGALVQVTNDA